MENLGILLGEVFDILNIEFELWGYSFSMWNILSFGCVTSTAAWAIWEIIDRS